MESTFISNIFSEENSDQISSKKSKGSISKNEISGYSFLLRKVSVYT